MKNNNKQKIEFSGFEKFLVGVALIFGILGLIIFIISIFYFKHGETYNNLKINDEKFGNFGSFISGAVGVLWSLVSVVLFYLTLRLQRKELGLQREELEMTREELKGQKDALEIANKFAALQQFDNKFFQLINLHQEIKNNIKIGAPTNYLDFAMDVTSGIEFFSKIATLISKNFLDTEEIKQHRYGLGFNEDKLIKLYSRAYHYYKSILGHYFRNLYLLVRIVHENSLLTDEQKKDYIKILRSQLSQYELVLLAYNGFSSNGNNFIQLIELYELIKNIDFELFTNAGTKPKIVNPVILTNKYSQLIEPYENQLKVFNSIK